MLGMFIDLSLLQIIIADFSLTDLYPISTTTYPLKVKFIRIQSLLWIFFLQFIIAIVKDFEKVFVQVKVPSAATLDTLH